MSAGRGGEQGGSIEREASTCCVLTIGYDIEQKKPRSAADVRGPWRAGNGHATRVFCIHILARPDHATL